MFPNGGRHDSSPACIPEEPSVLSVHLGAMGRHTGNGVAVHVWNPRIGDPRQTGCVLCQGLERQLVLLLHPKEFA